MSRGRTFFGLLLSAIYLIWVALLFLPKIHSITDLALNEIGDFLAGVFGPLAFLWLVLGYFQQGAELRQNNEALKMQADELKASVQQQVAMVDAQRETLHNYENSLSPLLRLKVENGALQNLDGEPHLMLSLSNRGEYCERIRVLCKGGVEVASYPTLFKDDAWIFYMGVDGMSPREGVEITVEYRSRSGTAGAQSFSLKERGNDGDSYFSVSKLAFLT